MRYIKLFDNYYTRLDIDPGFRRDIDLDPIFLHPVPFSREERETLRNLGFVYQKLLNIPERFVRQNMSNTYIYKVKDEWFYVQRVQDGVSRRI